MPMREFPADRLTFHQNWILMNPNYPASIIVIRNHIARLELLCIVFRHTKPSLIEPDSPPPKIRCAILDEAFDHLMKNLTLRANDIPHRFALIPTMKSPVHRIPPVLLLVRTFPAVAANAHVHTEPGRDTSFAMQETHIVCNRLKSSSAAWRLAHGAMWGKENERNLAPI